LSTATITRPPLLIGLYSETQGQGKSTVAHLISARLGHTSVLSFASPIKLAGAAFLEAMGLTDVEATDAVFDHKDVIIPSLGIRGRDALVMIGEQAREMVGPDVWVDAAFRKADPMRANAHLHIVFDDVRRPNEADAVLSRGGHLIRVVRPVKFDNVDGATEGRLNAYSFVHTIHNTGSLATLAESVRVALLAVRRAG
jgi:hypothetical protein